MKHFLAAAASLGVGLILGSAFLGCGLGHSAALDDAGTQAPSSSGSGGSGAKGGGTGSGGSTGGGGGSGGGSGSGTVVGAPDMPGLVVDGVTCASVVSEDGMRDGPPCGMNWDEQVTASCPGIGDVSLYLMSTSGIAYPQTCRAGSFDCSDPTTGTTSAGLTLGPADGGAGSFEFKSADGDCTILQGPTAGVDTMPIVASGVVSGSGVQHTFGYRAAPTR